MDAEDIIKDLEKTEQKIEKRQEKIIKWLKNPYNAAFAGILVFALIIRLYYFFLTKDQTVWWDAAEYMNMAKAWAFGLEYEFLPVRPVLFSLVIAGFLKIANNEFLPRAFLLIISMGSVLGIYFLGKEMFNKKIGLIASLLMSVFYLNIFFTNRVLVDLPSLTFYSFSAFLFYKYFKTNSKSSLYWAAAVLAIGILFKLPTISLALVVFIYILITQRLSFIKKKEIWIAALIFLLVLSPYLIWGYMKFGGFVITQAGAWNAPAKGTLLSTAFNNMKSYFSQFKTYLSWPLLISFLLGLALMYKVVLGFDVLLKGNKKLKRDFYLLLIFLIPIILVSFSLAHIENRYILNSFPAIFIISGVFMLKAYNFIKQYKKFLAVLFLIIILGSITYFQLQYTDSLIKSKKGSYSQVREAGLWLKGNTSPPDIIVTKSRPQIKYYSEREVIRIPDTKEEFEKELASNSDIKIYMVSIFENHLEWTYSYAQENNLTPIKVYFAGPNQEQATLIIYRL